MSTTGPQAPNRLPVFLGMKNHSPREWTDQDETGKIAAKPDFHPDSPVRGIPAGTVQGQNVGLPISFPLRAHRFKQHHLSSHIVGNTCVPAVRLAFKRIRLCVSHAHRKMQLLGNRLQSNSSIRFKVWIWSASDADELMRSGSSKIPQQKATTLFSLPAWTL